MSKSEKVLVTGGAGFIGSHLVDRLVNEGYMVRIIDDLSSGKLENIKVHLGKGKVEFIQGDIRDSALIKKCVNGVNAVVHLAAQTSVPFSIKNPDLTLDVNVSGSLKLMNACTETGVKRFVFASSCAVYGDPETLPVKENSQVNPISPYAESKLTVERYCLDFYVKGNLEPVILRFFNVFGSRQGLSEYSGVITLFINRCKLGLPLVIYGDGSQSRDFINVSDVVEGILAAVRCSGIEGYIFNIGSGKATSINELAKTVLDLTGKNLEIQHAEPRTGDIKDSYADISNAKQLLGFKPQVNLREGLKTLIKN